MAGTIAAESDALQDPKVAEQLGERWQDAIMDLCDDELLFTQAGSLRLSTLVCALACAFLT